jgi:hypothetical protein
MMHTTAFDDSAAQHSDPLRSTALLMHTMAASDRAWTMDKLTPAQRESIAPLLAELDALEFSTDGFEFDSPPALPPKPPVQSSLTADEQLIAALDAVPASRIRAALRGEPVALVRRLAAMHRWSWREAVVVDGGTGAHEALVTPEAAKPALSVLDRAVLDALRERVKAPFPAVETKDDRTQRWRLAAAAVRHHVSRVVRTFARDTSPTLS